MMSWCYQIIFMKYHTEISLFMNLPTIAYVKAPKACLDNRCENKKSIPHHIKTNVCVHRRTVVCPIIDVISDDTFEYMAGSDMTYGGFNWKLNFRWYPVPQREMDRRKGDRTLPVR